LKNTPAKREGNTVYIDTNIIITNIRARKKFDLVWGVVSAVFEIQTDVGTVIPLVQRSHNTSHPLEWALLPSGGIDSIAELQCPNRAMEREIYEELRFYQNDKYIYPLIFHHEDSEVVIFDKAKGKKFQAYGEFFEYNHTLFLIATYKSKRKFELDNFVVFDGEKKDNKFLHRNVALLSVDSTLYGKVKPVARYKAGNREANLCIDFNKSKTPTLEFLRKKWKR